MIVKSNTYPRRIIPLEKGDKVRWYFHVRFFCLCKLNSKSIIAISEYCDMDGMKNDGEKIKLKGNISQNKRWGYCLEVG